MIEQLMVKDYILFDEATVDFKRDMEVITGETGAGKSLLIDAISYLSGARMPAGVVRKGAEQAVLQMVLSAPEGAAADLMEENGFDSQEEIIITRIVTGNGKSKVRINNRAASLAFVRQLTGMLIDVHSQMDTIQLLNPAVQLELLDAFANAGELKASVQAAYKAYAKSRSELKKAKSETFSDDELDFVTAQLNEIQAANAVEGELEELQEKIRQAEKSAKNTEDFSTVLYALHKDGGVVDSLYEIYRIMSRNDLMEADAKGVQDAYYAMQALYDDLQDKLEAWQKDAQDLDAMQEREYLLKKLYRKYGGSYESMLTRKQALEDKVDRILHRQDLFEKLEKQLKTDYAAYMVQAKALSEKRKSVFAFLEEAIEGHAHDMMLANAKFKIQASEKAPSEDGLDAIEFMVSMNPGQPLTTLRQSASGGELARLMLALKVVFQASAGIDTIVFDEIDTGVSGKVALAMGSKMHSLAGKYQVLCITHLPSVAVWADTHLRVSKSSQEDMTTTRVEVLDEKEDLEELAIMAAGQASDQAVEGMRQLKESIRG